MNRTNHTIDATGQSVGRMASKIAMILRGKNKPDFVPHIDNGDSVTVINAAKLHFTGRKYAQKDFYHHSMHPGGLKREALKTMFDRDPSEVVRHAVWGMLPKNKHRENLFKRLTVSN